MVAVPEAERGEISYSAQRLGLFLGAISGMYICCMDVGYNYRVRV